MNPKTVTSVELQARCDQLVAQHFDALLQLRQDVVTLVREAGSTLSVRWPDPAEIHGQLFCTLVRGLLLNELMGRQDPDKPAPAGVLRTRCGPGMSVVMEDLKGGRWRVRRVPSEFVLDHGRLVVYPSKAAADAVRSGKPVPDQASFGPEFDSLPRTVRSDAYDWFVLWALSEDAIQVPSVFLAAVHDIDNPSKVVVLAQTQLPVVAAAAEGDFEEYRGTGGAESAGPENA